MTKLTLQIGNRTISAQDPDEGLTYRELLEMFSGLMVGHTFTEERLMEEMRSYGEA